jgi:hypothetical protein
VADMLGLVPGVHYCRFVASDRHYVDEAMTTLRHPQVMLAWLMNDGGRFLPGTVRRCGSSCRSAYGSNRSIKAITEKKSGQRATPSPADGRRWCEGASEAGGVESGGWARHLLPYPPYPPSPTLPDPPPSPIVPQSPP